MEELFKDLKLMFDDEDIIGKTEDIIEAFYILIIYDIHNVEDLEERATDIAEKFDFIQTLMNDLEDNEIRLKTIIKVTYNPMGGYNYGVV
jgi:uncharacterized protein YutD